MMLFTSKKEKRRALNKVVGDDRIVDTPSGGYVQKRGRVDGVLTSHTALINGPPLVKQDPNIRSQRMDKKKKGMKKRSVPSILRR